MKKILVVAPHPDDEVLGCGGAILRHVKRGDEVSVCIVTQAYTPDWSEEFLENRHKEIKKAAQLLKTKKTFLLGFPTVKLDTIPQKDFYKSILNIINTVSPDIVYFPHGGDINKDHRLVFEICLAATKPSNKTSIKKSLCYETISETDEGRNLKEFSPNVYLQINNEIKKKIEAMEAYKSEVRKFPHPRSLEMIEILAKKRGSESGFKFAEAFMLIREIIS